MQRQNFYWKLAVIALTALFMRVLVGEVLRPIPHIGGMSTDYLAYASNLLDHGVYSEQKEGELRPNSLRMPLYPLFLAAVRIISGPAQWIQWVVSIQYLMGAAICALIGFLGLKLWDERVGLVAALLSCFYIDYYYLTIVLLREQLQLLLFFVFLMCWVEFVRKKSSPAILGSSFLFGLMVLNRPEIVILGGVLFILYFSEVKDFIRKSKVAAALALLLTVGPWLGWVGRNYKVHQHFVPFSTDGAWVLYMGQVYHPDETYSKADPNALAIIDSTPVEMDWARQLQSEAIASLKAHPWRNLGWVAVKIRITFQEFSQNRLSLLWPILWVIFPLIIWQGRRGYRWAVAGGIAAALIHLACGDWDWPVLVQLLQVSFSDMVLLGAIGFGWILIKRGNDGWKILAAPFLTLIISTAIFIALLRSRLVLCDWILILAAAYVIVEFTAWARLRVQSKFQPSGS